VRALSLKQRTEETAGEKSSPARLVLLDELRGGALLAMILFHFTWDLDYFGLAPPGLTASPQFKWLGDAIAATFLLVVGASLALAARGGWRARPFWMRLAKIAGAAALVSLATWFVFPDEFIFFGVLHCIALSSLAAAPLLRAPVSLVLAVAAIALALPLLVASPMFDAPIWWWLGLGTHQPLSNDWRPFLPWFGVVLLGMAIARGALARALPERLARLRARSLAGRALVLGGRRSLLVYLVHQPLLFGALYLGVAAIGLKPPSEAAAFARNCAAQCTAQGARAGYCGKVCGCVAARAQPSSLWRHVLENRLSVSQRVRFNAMAKECIQKFRHVN